MSNLDSHSLFFVMTYIHTKLNKIHKGMSFFMNSQGIHVSTKALLSHLLRSPDWKANLCMKPGPQLNPEAIKLFP